MDCDMAVWTIHFWYIFSFFNIFLVFVLSVKRPLSWNGVLYLNWWPFWIDSILGFDVLPQLTGKHLFQGLSGLKWLLSKCPDFLICSKSSPFANWSASTDAIKEQISLCVAVTALPFSHCSSFNYTKGRGSHADRPGPRSPSPRINTINTIFDVW